MAWKFLIYSVLPISCVGFSITSNNETWTSIKKSKIKCVVYLSAIVSFLVCLLIAVDIIPLKAAINGNPANRTASGWGIVVMISAVVVQIATMVVVVVTTNMFNKEKREKNALQEMLEQKALKATSKQKALKEMLKQEALEKTSEQEALQEMSEQEDLEEISEEEALEE